jgi:signal transduction histidine kinase
MRRRAHTALDFRRPSKAFEDLVAQGGIGMRTLGLRGATPLQGGVPIVADGKIIGAVGVSGGTAQAEPHEVLVAVKDSGPGLAANDLERILDPFYSTKPGGLGMGLSICRSIIEAHEGRLWVTANVPSGAIFHFTVPAHGVAPDN